MRVIILLLSVLALAATPPSPTLVKVRINFESASKSESNCDALLASLRGHTLESNVVYYCYLGAAETIHAQYSSNPYTKLTRFNNGKAKIDAAVAKQNQSMELRYLRFTVQCGAPSFLGYNDEIAADKKFLLDGLKKLSADDNDLYTRIAKYLDQCEQLTAAEKQQLSAIKKEASAKK
ncbi:MAG: hypothetical protein MUC87_13285 [Bacteroidia bacterium]|jgi:hypothetical protein|nr:hypothetical protein [Bacteroidia bacterium]